MNPWTVTGWIVFVLEALIISLFVIWVSVVAAVWVAQRMMHVRTREDSPRAGDVWIEGFALLRDSKGAIHVEEIAPNGRVALRTEVRGSTISWSHSPEEWRERVRKHKLWRSRP